MSKHRKVEHGVGGINLGLIVTPMLDMAFQILSFFIMTYHPSALEGHIPGSLVPPSENATRGKETIASMETPASVPEDLLNEELNQAVQVKLKAVPKGGSVPNSNRREGQLTQILIKQPSDASYQTIADVDSEIDQAVSILEKQLKSMPADTKTNIKIEGDGDLRQAYVMMAYDVCKKAGFSKVHFVPPPLLREQK
jgi:biopolymer transport protein ExbD